MAAVAICPREKHARAAAQAAEPVWQRVAIFALVFVAACIMFFSSLGDHPLFNPDEALYAEPAREMLETGEYVTTLLNYVVRYTKPPLVIWGMAGCYQIFGVNEFAARFIGAACGALAVAVTYLMLEKYASRRAAVLASFALITSPLFIGTAREAITDMPLTFMIASALFAFFHGFASRRPGWKWVAYALVGLAVMTKGPVGLVLPVAIMFAYHYLRGDLKEAWAYHKPLHGLLVVALIAVPWFAVEIYVTKGAYYREFLLRENFQRFTGVVDHKAAWWYHLAVVAGGFLPWTIFIPQSFVSAIRSWRFTPGRIPGYGLLGELPTSQAFSLFCVLTFAIILSFFSISVSKLIPYTVPGFPALACLVGIYLDKSLRERNSKAFLFPFLVLTVALGVGIAVVPVAVNRLREAPAELVSILYSALLVLLVIGMASCLSSFRRRPAAAITFFTITFYFALFGFGGRALDVLSREWEGPLTHFAQYAAVSDRPIFVFHMRKPSVPFYAHRPVQVPYDEAELIHGLGEANGAYILGKARDLTFFQSLPNCHLVAQDGRFVLIAQQPRR
jgi:4-amino-4-deoxy-L-arabinose transferase-like glycosyltransferase